MPSPPTLDRGPPGRAPSPPRFSRVLRERTREAHVRAEACFALDRRLLDRSTYRKLLLSLQAYHRPVEAALAAVDGWERLEPAIDPEAYRRADLLDEDLTHFDGEPHVAVNVGERAPERPGVQSLARALGCLYVLEGSARGGRIVAAEAGRRLPGVPVAFFSSAGRGPGADWPALQSALDAFGASGGRTAVEETVDGALETFDTFGAWLDRDGAA